jgi:hypothetical protein
MGLIRFGGVIESHDATAPLRRRRTGVSSREGSVHTAAMPARNLPPGMNDTARRRP